MSDPTDNNLLVALHRLASTQDENFVTEAFAHLLRHLLEHEPAVGTGLLRSLTKGRVDVSEDEAGGVSVVTQVATSEGTPDVAISTTDNYVLIEVKLESPVDHKQLARYRGVLDASGFDRTTLILLTRHAVEREDTVDVMVRWYRVADWLRERISQVKWQNAASEHLVRQFVAFLQVRGVTMEKVNWQMVEGVKSMRNLISMIEEVLSNKRKKHTSSFGRWWSGFYIGDNKAWIGIWPDSPEYLAFQVEVPHGERPTTAPDFGEIGDGKYAPYRWNWSYRLDLSSEDVHFFALSQASQMQRLEEFVDKGLSACAALAVTTKAPGDSGEKRPSKA